jgi:hypothetical protein
MMINRRYYKKYIYFRSMSDYTDPYTSTEPRHRKTTILLPILAALAYIYHRQIRL